MMPTIRGHSRVNLNHLKKGHPKMKLNSDEKQAKDLAMFIDSQKWGDPRALLTALILILGSTTIHMGISCEDAQDLVSGVIENVYTQIESITTTQGMTMQ